MKRIYILLGGLYSVDAAITSGGMYKLADRITHEVPSSVVRTYKWANYQQCAWDIVGDYNGDDKVALIGYSGGGWRAATASRICYMHGRDINLLVGYDPSPSWNMNLPENVLHDNVKLAVCYKNSQKMLAPLLAFPPWGWIGGGEYFVANKGHPNVVNLQINENHLAVQYDEALHMNTINELRQM